MSKKIIKKIRQIVADEQYHKNYQTVLNWRSKYWKNEDVLLQIATFLERHSQTCQKCLPVVLKKDLKLAAKTFNQILFLNPGSKPAILFFAKKWFNKPGPKFKQAIGQMIKLTGEKGCYAYLGHHHQARKNFHLAKKYFLKALPFIRSHYGIYYALAKLAHEQDKKTECAKWSQRALKTYQKMAGRYKNDPITKLFVAELRAWTKEKQKRPGKNRV